MKLTAGRIVQVHDNDGLDSDWKAGLVTHVYPWGALVRIFFSTPGMDRVATVSNEPTTAHADSNWVWRWPPREES